MSVRNLLPIVLLLAAVSLTRCSGSPTQAEGTVTLTVTTSTTTSTTTTTTVIPQLNPGAIATSPSGKGVAWATVYTFLYSTPPSGGVPPYTFAWNFGDGGAATGEAPSHAYMNAGSFVATATATDSRGMTATASVPVSIRPVTGRWTATITGLANPEPIDLVQNQTAVTATINSANGFGLATGTGNVSNPRSLSISAVYANGGSPFATTFIGRMDDTLEVWSGTVTGFAGCPCLFTATRPAAVGDTALR
jgi:hypothetical protein